MFKNTYSKLLVLSLLSVFIWSSCSQTEDQKDKKDQPVTKSEKKRTPKTTTLSQYQAKFDIQTPSVGQVMLRGDLLDLELNIVEDDRKIDSLEYFINHKKVKLQDHKINSQNFKSGRNDITVKSHHSDGSNDQVSTFVMALSDKTPPISKVKVLKTFPHDVTAYTQGLIFTEGFLYEGTGQYRESMLKKVDLNKNDLIQSYNLPKEVFGEGIVNHQDKIFQITWQSKRAFVYDINTFSLIHEFQYDTEGWGITNYKENLIMSDGTQNLYIITPESFSVVDQLQVTDHIGPINNLNELEWIEGKIWANVYLTNTIVIIDPETGFVEQKLDLSTLVPDTYANPHDNVLNGIAYDQKNKKIYVTGKRWPVLYEIEIIK